MMVCSGHINFRNYIDAVGEMFQLPVPWTVQRVIGLLSSLFSRSLCNTITATRIYAGLVFLCVIFPLYEFINHLLLGLDEILFSDYKKIPLAKPVLMVGNARSGTTFGHRLMIADPRYSLPFAACL